MVGQCVNYYLTLIFDRLTIYLILTLWISRWTPRQVTFSRLEYPQHLHVAHTDLPFCPTRDKPPDKRWDKLLATLYDKKRYIIVTYSSVFVTASVSRIAILAISMVSQLYRA